MLRTSWLAPHGAGPFGQAQFVAALYIVYHLSAALAAAPAGAAADERGAGIVISWGTSLLRGALSGEAPAWKQRGSASSCRIGNQIGDAGTRWATMAG